MALIRSRRVQSATSCKIVKKVVASDSPCPDYFDKEPFRLYPNCNIWVFDNLLSSSFLALTDQEFMNGEKIVKQAKYNPHLKTTQVRIPRMSWSAEVFEVLLRISNVRPIEIPSFFIVREVTGQTDHHPQNEHMDYASLEDIDIKTQLSWDQFQFDTSHEKIPTFSFIVYFKNIGRIVFPNVGETVNARRGRIVMFQNYHNHINRKIDYRALHYGTYSTEPKRLALFGILTETIPVTALPKPLALLYSPNWHHLLYSYTKSASVVRPPGTLVWKLESFSGYCCWVLYVITAIEGSTSENLFYIDDTPSITHNKYKYTLEPCQTNFFNIHIDNFTNLCYGRTIEGFDSVSFQYHRDIDYELAVDDILEFIGLSQPVSRTGWICRITKAQREARRTEWRSVGCTCLPGLDTNIEQKCGYKSFRRAVVTTMGYSNNYDHILALYYAFLEYKDIGSYEQVMLIIVEMTWEKKKHDWWPYK